MHPVQTLTVAELRIAAESGGGRRVRRELDRRWHILAASKPPGHLAIIERRSPAWPPDWYWRRRPVSVTNAALEALGPGGRAIRAERLRRARGLLLGALELRAALIECMPTQREWLWRWGIP